MISFFIRSSQNISRWRLKYIPRGVRKGWGRRGRSSPMEIYRIQSSGDTEPSEEFSKIDGPMDSSNMWGQNFPAELPKG